jgi:3-oxoacyl-[acyl-carrier-protein] synthase II
MMTQRDHGADREHGADRAVSLTGFGAVSGYGWGQKLLREGLSTGIPAARRLPGFQPYFDDDWGWVAPIEDGGDPEDGPSRFARSVRFAAREAVGQAMDRGWRPGPVVGLVHGFVLGDVDHWRTYHHRHGFETSRRGWLELMPSTVLTGIMKEFDFHGPAMAVTAMCATGLAGLLTAKLWIEAGLATDVLVLASDLSINPENARSFANLGPCIIDAPPLEVCRPFQEGSRGFSAGEASVATVVSGRPAGTIATLRGGAMTHDGFHPVSIAPDGAEVRRCFELALADAGVAGEEIVYLNAHGTGTLQCDTTESAVFDALFPAAEGLFSVKPLVGHCQGASSAVEVLATVCGFETGIIPAPHRQAPGHPRLLDGPTRCVDGPVMKSSLGMGGHNAVVVLEPGHC